MKVLCYGLLPAALMKGEFDDADDHGKEAHGFGMFMLKAVISGRGDELIDLAKVNLFR